MAQPVSLNYQRQQTRYWDAELALSIALHERGTVSGRHLSERIRVVSNLQHNQAPFAHRFAGQKEYRHD